MQAWSDGSIHAYNVKIYQHAEENHRCTQRQKKGNSLAWIWTWVHPHFLDMVLNHWTIWKLPKRLGYWALVNQQDMLSKVVREAFTASQLSIITQDGHQSWFGRVGIVSDPLKDTRGYQALAIKPVRILNNFHNMVASNDILTPYCGLGRWRHMCIW